ncbi:MAG: hypothetical protein QF363_05105 [Planctomycetaceae bacterium]|jgi:hypothetical protein|nr:hypothetical protein [Planctomycetaceae bacterium]
MACLASTRKRTQGRWIAAPGWLKTNRRPSRRRSQGVSFGESLEPRTLLSVVAAAAWGSFDPAPARQVPHQQPAGRTSGNQHSATGQRQDQHHVEVLVFIDSGRFNTGHADVALVDGDTTTVYGQHRSGHGNGGFRDSTFKRRSLAAYLEDEASGGHRVYVSSIPVSEQQFNQIRAYLDHQWQNDVDYNLFDDNCSQNVAFVLKQWNLLSNWKGEGNVINDDAFQLPEADLYNDWLKTDKAWSHQAPGYLAPTLDGMSLFDSVQETLPKGITPSPSTGSGSSFGTGNGSGNRGRISSSIPDDEGDRHGRMQWDADASPAGSLRQRSGSVP